MVVEALKEGQESGTAVLYSSGLDSAVLLAREAHRGRVQPIYISVGLAWESAERDAVTRLLAAASIDGRICPLVHLENNVRDIYPTSHWAIRGVPPAYDTPDRDVYLLGRNVMLLSTAAVFCAQRGISRVAIGPLADNPFPDANPEFFSAMARALSLGLAHDIDIVSPFAMLHKTEVIKLGLSLRVPFELTLSCLNPTGRRHCGRCSKCRERLQAFAKIGMRDPAEDAEPATSMATQSTKDTSLGVGRSGRDSG